jgi:hypothetical protein
MKIIKQYVPPAKVSINTLKDGDVFDWGGEIYMLCGSYTTGPVVINLRTGHALRETAFEGNHATLVDATLTVTSNTLTGS